HNSIVQTLFDDFRNSNHNLRKLQKELHEHFISLINQHLASERTEESINFALSNFYAKTAVYGVSAAARYWIEHTAFSFTPRKSRLYNRYKQAQAKTLEEIFVEEPIQTATADTSITSLETE